MAYTTCQHFARRTALHFPSPFLFWFRGNQYLENSLTSILTSPESFKFPATGGSNICLGLSWAEVSVYRFGKSAQNRGGAETRWKKKWLRWTNMLFKVLINQFSRAGENLKFGLCTCFFSTHLDLTSFSFSSLPSRSALPLISFLHISLAPTSLTTPALQRNMPTFQSHIYIFVVCVGCLSPRSDGVI